MTARAGSEAARAREPVSGARGLPFRARFVLQHCERPMRFLGSLAQLTEQGAVATGCEYTCDQCSARLALTLTEAGTTT